MNWLRPPSISHTGWRVSWRLKDLLGDDESPAATAKAAREMHARLEALRTESFGSFWADDEEIAGISDEFHTIGFVDGDEKASSREFNIVMDALYDWADDQRVLIGGQVPT